MQLSNSMAAMIVLVRRRILTRLLHHHSAASLLSVFRHFLDSCFARKTVTKTYFDSRSNELLCTRLLANTVCSTGVDELHPELNPPRVHAEVMKAEGVRGDGGFCQGVRGGGPVQHSKSNQAKAGRQSERASDCGWRRCSAEVSTGPCWAPNAALEVIGSQKAVHYRGAGRGNNTARGQRGGEGGTPHCVLAASVPAPLWDRS